MARPSDLRPPRPQHSGSPCPAVCVCVENSLEDSPCLGTCPIGPDTGLDLPHSMHFSA